jgi:hypothetical protein
LLGARVRAEDGVISIDAQAHDLSLVSICDAGNRCGVNTTFVQENRRPDFNVTGLHPVAHGSCGNRVERGARHDNTVNACVQHSQSGSVRGFGNELTVEAVIGRRKLKQPQSCNRERKYRSRLNNGQTNGNFSRWKEKQPVCPNECDSSSAARCIGNQITQTGLPAVDDIQLQ